MAMLLMQCLLRITSKVDAFAAKISFSRAFLTDCSRTSRFLATVLDIGTAVSFLMAIVVINEESQLLIPFDIKIMLL